MLGVETDNKLKFDEHVRNCENISRKTDIYFSKLQVGKVKWKSVERFYNTSIDFFGLCYHDRLQA